MEAAAIAQVCASHGVPFLAVKDVSNNELLKNAATESGRSMVDQIGAEIGRRAGALTLAILRDLPCPPPPAPRRGAAGSATG
jgi:nucleoside phosphorylase